jgi:hypothetical protein
MKKIIALCLILFLSFNANAAQPTVTTGVATLITTDSAKLNGTVNPNSASTTWYFEYGLTVSYGLKTDALKAGSGTATLVGFTYISEL